MGWPGQHMGAFDWSPWGIVTDISLYRECLNFAMWCYSLSIETVVVYPPRLRPIINVLKDLSDS